MKSDKNMCGAKTEKSLKWYGKWAAPVQNTAITSVRDIELDKVVGMFEAANQVGVKNPYGTPAEPVQYMRKVFCLQNKKIKSADLYITARGLYEAYINGKPVTDTLLNPGFTSYDSFTEYQSYKVDELLQTDNCIGIKLADGWYKGKYGLMAFGGNYGKETAVLFQIEILYEDDTREVIFSDQTMVSTEGAEIYSDFLCGEKYDARKEIEGWNCVGTIQNCPDERTGSKDTENSWKPCHILENAGYEGLVPESCPGVKVTECHPVKEILHTPKGETILDFGVNMAGYVEMYVEGEAGTEVTLEHCEVLDENGNFYNSTFGYDRDQKAIYICDGKGGRKYSPSFTFYGFRYVKISGYPSEIEKKNFTAKSISSAIRKTGDFRCSDRMLTKLQENIVRSQKSNFIAVPTDCPQREKAGWTGDVEVYAETAAFNQDVREFLNRWLKCVRADQLDNGEIPIIAPYVEGYKSFQKPLMGADSSSGWGDVIIHLPWMLYQQYDCIEFLQDNFEAMEKWMRFVEKEAEENVPESFTVEGLSPEEAKAARERQKYLWNTGFHFGDWLYPSSKDKNGNTEMMGGTFSTAPITATCFYAMDTEIMDKVCKLLGKAEEAEKYSSLNKKIKKAFCDEYIISEGKLAVELQGMYVLALAAGMCRGEEAKSLAKHLNEMIIRNDYCLDAGFMSIKYLMDVLVDYGYYGTAKQVLYQEKCPSWLYEVKNGATTMWETWDAIRPDGKPTPVSYNHYAFGCVGDWMYRTLLGLKRMSPGWKKFKVEPCFKFGLDWAEGFYEGNYGKILFRWEKEDGQVICRLTVPQESTAIVQLPDVKKGSVSVNGESCPESEIALNGGEYLIKYTLNI